MKKEQRIPSRKDGRLIKSITIDEATHAKLRALSFWLCQHTGSKVTLSSLVMEVVLAAPPTTRLERPPV